MQSKGVIFASPKDDDKVRDYGMRVLETGAIFFHLKSLVKCPNRTKMLSTLKAVLVALISTGDRAQYPVAIMRMLITQFSLLGQREAAEMFHQSTVNTKGREDSHVPVDQVVEWNVKNQKRHIKHLMSNRSNEVAIKRRSTALGDISSVSTKFDKNVGTRERHRSKNKEPSSEDVETIFGDLKVVRPFKDGRETRSHKYFEKIEPSAVNSFDGSCLVGNFHTHKGNFHI